MRLFKSPRLKESMLCIALLVSALGFSQPQRLLVPKISNAQADSYGRISLQAYCIDPTLIWPAQDDPLDKVLFDTQTLLTRKKGGVLGTVTLASAIQNREVKIVSSSGGVQLHPLRRDIQLIKMKTSGFVVGKNSQQVNSQEAVHLISLLSVDPSFENWRKDQLTIHQELLRSYSATDKQARLSEYASNWLLPIRTRSYLWVVTVANEGLIQIQEQKLPSPGGGGRVPPYALDDLKYTLKRDFEDLQMCFTINTDSMLELSFSGNYKGIMPVTVSFSSENEFTVTAVTQSAELTAGSEVTLPITIQRSVSTSRDDDECKVELSGVEICYPPKESSVSAEVCGVDVSLSASGITLDF